MSITPKRWKTMHFFWGGQTSEVSWWFLLFSWSSIFPWTETVSSQGWFFSVFPELWKAKSESISQVLNVWYIIYLLVNSYGKCSHTLSAWVCFISLFWCQVDGGSHPSWKQSSIIAREGLFGRLFHKQWWFAGFWGGRFVWYLFGLDFDIGGERCVLVSRVLSPRASMCCRFA